MQKRLLSLMSLVLSFAFVIAASSTALAEDFYKGKTIRLVVGYSPGGGYDTYTRAAARHISKHIPGNPTPIVQNMTGAGSLVAANYLYTRARPDGLTMGIWNSGIILQQALGGKGIKFDAAKFGWVGAPVKGFPTCAVMGFTGLKTLKEVLNSKKPIKMGGTRVGSSTDDTPRILNKTMGSNFRVISGYKGTAKIRLALQAREVDGVCFGWESMSVTARSMLDAPGDNKLIPFLTHGQSNDPELKGIPQITEVIKDKDKLAVFTAWVSTFEFQRPLSLPPGTPKDRVKILRKAYNATLHDKAFLADAKKSKLIINYVSGGEIDKLVAGVLATPAKAKESLQFLVKKKKKKK